METKNRKTYEAPEAVVVRVQSEGLICDSGNHVMWLLTDPDKISTDAGWSRGDYGGANEI